MEEEFSADVAQLMEAASDFAHHPGPQSDSSAKDFLDHYPLPAIISTLQTKADVPGLESALVACLERVFNTKYGASLIPQYMPFIIVGLGADSQRVRYLACKTVSCLLENYVETKVTASRLLFEYDVYPLLLGCLVDGDEEVAAASMDAIKNLVNAPGGMGIIFPANTNESAHLQNLAARCSSLGRVRVLALIVKLFSTSSSVASAVYNSNLLSLLEAELSNTNDVLVTLNVLELLYELAEVQHGLELLSRTNLLQLMCSIICNASAESILRSRAMMISGRLLSKENILGFFDESSVKNIISSIEGRFALMGSHDADECECAVEALGQIGSSNQGAAMLLSSSLPATRYIVNAVSDRQVHGRQLAALHALSNIVGETRPENNLMLNDDAEESLRRLIYETASKSPKLTPSGLLLSVLQQESQIRLAGYRLITGLVVRPWCLMEICSRQEIIDIVTHTSAETNKIGMEARHKCCQAIFKAFISSRLINDPTIAVVASKLQEAIGRGPYLDRKQQPEAQPVVMTAERF